MAVDMFLKIDDVLGESVDNATPSHAGEIQILSWSWGMTQSGSTHMGTGSGSGKVNVSDITITKYVDRSTPNLLASCCNGTHYKQAQLTVRKAGKTPVEYIKIFLYNILISGVTTGGSGGEDKLTENVTLNFGQFEFDYTTQTADGKQDKTIPMTWNIAGNSDKLQK
jgi:type VI secretion system secreted protein Hcp